MQNYSWGQLQKQAENAGGGEPLPSSDYTVTVASVDFKTTQNGKPMWKVKAKVVGGPLEGRTIWNNYVLSVENDQAVAIFMRHMNAFGLTAEWFSQEPSNEQVGEALLGRSAVWEVGQKSYNNELRNEVKNTKPCIGGVPAPTVAAAAPSVGAVPNVPQVPETAPAPPVPPTVATPVAPAPAPAPAPVPAPGTHLNPPPAPAPAPVPPVAAPSAPAAPEVPVADSTAPPRPPF